MIELELVPRRAALLAGQDNSVDVVLRAKGPTAPESSRQRLALNLSIVIDRSGSMSGRPLDEAKRCASMIVDRLSPHDHASVIAYDDAVDVLMSSRPVEDKEAFHRAIRAVESRGYTALHDGWLTGAEQAARTQSKQSLSRVLLLSDGCANKGLCEVPAVAKHCAEMAHAGVGTSTYGLGESFNEELMTAMARSGQGNAYYGRTADDLMDPFREEFDLMSALCARGLRLALTPAAGVRVEVVNRYARDAEGRSILPDLAYGSEAWALLRLAVPRSVVESEGVGDIHLLTAHLAYADLEGRQHRSAPAHLRLPRLPAAAFAAIAADVLVASRARELDAAQLQEDGRVAAMRGDWFEVDRLLGELRALAADSPWLQASVAELERYAMRRETQLYSKEAYYKAARMRTRLASLAEESASWSLDEEAAKPSYLRRKPEQGKRLDAPKNDKDPSGA